MKTLILGGDNTLLFTTLGGAIIRRYTVVTSHHNNFTVIWEKYLITTNLVPNELSSEKND